MTDDTERRLRESLRAANLPGAPETLHDALRAVADSPVVLPPHRTWVGTLPALAAVVVLAIVAGVMTGGFGRFGPTISSASPSGSAMASLPASAAATPLATTSVAPPATGAPSPVAVLDTAGLRSAIDAVKAGTAGAQDVIVDTGATAGCAPGSSGQEACRIVALLDGMDAASGTVAIRGRDGVLPPPFTAADLQAPLALHIADDGSLELIGHVDLAPGAGQLDMDGLRAATATALPGHVVAALGWLGMREGGSCGPSGLGLPQPFDCPGVWSFLSDQPLEASVHDANGIGGTLGRNGEVRVGAFTYRQFAPSPVISNSNGVPRLGVYLLRMVAVDQSGCQGCRGWLVGRLAGSPIVSPVRYDGTRVYTAAELETALLTDRSVWVGKAVMVEGRLVGPLPSCPAAVGGATACIVGWLSGTNEAVTLRSYTASLLDATGQGNDAQPRKVMIVLPEGLELVGMLGNDASQAYQASPGDLNSLLTDFTAQPAHVFAVDAYLGWSGPLPCPSVPGSPPPPDTPFGSGCPWAWLSATDGSKAPPDSVAVQSGAYDEFAGATPGSTTPVHGTYLVRLVLDTRPGKDNTRGWQVIGRLDAGSGPSSVPSPAANVLTTGDLVSALASNRQAKEGTIVLVSGRMTRVPAGDSCDVVAPSAQASRVCAFATLDGTSEEVYAGADTAASYAGRPSDVLTGTFALRVLPAGLELVASPSP